MTAAELLATRVAPLWMPTGMVAGQHLAYAMAALGQRHRKADGTSLTQFNTGGLVVREATILALTDCHPISTPVALQLRPPSKARLAVIEDIRAHGPPLLAVLFAKGALDIRAWACSTPDEVVINGVAGPEETAAMEDVAELRALPGTPRDWRRMASLCADALADLAKAPTLHAEADKMGKKHEIAREQVLDVAYRLRRATGLTFDLAATDA
ncbi:hypothetical protein AAFN86_19615 [Roseomonas sp. CAU 1739]|uniref:hypothetical protein n=1 Tax=Roseomonas sp. CAU 1739 TaxID=3140364 RepID=UPI00325BB4F5